MKRIGVGLMVLLSWKRFWGILRKRVSKIDKNHPRKDPWSLETIILIVNYCGIGFLSTAVLPFLLSILFP
jgi:preprotein translocase subunit Sec63